LFPKIKERGKTISGIDGGSKIAKENVPNLGKNGEFEGINPWQYLQKDEQKFSIAPESIVPEYKRKFNFLSIKI